MGDSVEVLTDGGDLNPDPRGGFIPELSRL